MARISDVELERLKREVSLERLVEAKGIKLERKGPDNLVALCPFHEESTASFTVSPSKNLWRCFGCNNGGTVIDFVMKAQGVGFRHAVELLREGALLSSSAPATRSKVRRLAMPVDAAAEDKQLLHQVVDYYHRTLKESPVVVQGSFMPTLPQDRRAVGAEDRGLDRDLRAIDAGDRSRTRTAQSPRPRARPSSRNGCRQIQPAGRSSMTGR